MRQIKFRGKRVDNGEWVKGDLMQNHIHHDGFLTIVQNGCIYNKVDPSTVGQLRYTNKEGVEYYDGDIYYHAGYGDVIVSDVCELQMALYSGNTDDIEKIKGNIYEK